jgi:hypothetical protein
MAFADPQTVTFNAVPYTLARVSSGIDSGGFLNQSGDVKLTVAHAYESAFDGRSALIARRLLPTL